MWRTSRRRPRSCATGPDQGKGQWRRHARRVLQIVETFRARVVDVALKTLMVSHGTDDKVSSLVGVLRPYGIVEWCAQDASRWRGTGDASS